MSEPVSDIDQFLLDDGMATLVIKQHLRPAEGKGAVIFPPTYAASKYDADDRPRYNIDGGNSDTKTLTAVIDSIQSQANRAEPKFKLKGYSHLVPQIVITHGGGSCNLLDAGHRAADAIVRFSEMMVEFDNAFRAYATGDAVPMAKLAPTSLVFGAWDSRGTQVKIPRLINMRIDAADVERRTRSAAYKPATDYVAFGLIDEVDESTGSDLGFAGALATGSLGGVVARGAITRTCSFNVTTLRDLNAPRENDRQALQRYILGLTLVAITAMDARDLSLRQGCQLVVDAGSAPIFEAVRVNGNTVPLVITAESALKFATEAAANFGVGESRTVGFDTPLANRIRKLWSVKKTREQLKAIAKLRPLTSAELDRFEAGDKNTVKALADAIGNIELPKKAKKDAPPVIASDAFEPILSAVNVLLADPSSADDVVSTCHSIRQLVAADQDSHTTLKAIKDAIKQLNGGRKSGRSGDGANDSSGGGN